MSYRKYPLGYFTYTITWHDMQEIGINMNDDNQPSGRNILGDEITRIAIDEDHELGRMTTPARRYQEPDEDFTADCPVHGEVQFKYNEPMNAFFCRHYHWGSEENFIEGECCDSVVLVVDMVEDPDGGPVRHRRSMEKITDEEYSLGSLHRTAGEITQTLDGLKERFKLTKRQEPTPPPGNLPKL